MSAQTIGLMLRERARNPGRRSPPVCLFLGAGTDIESGGLTFQQLKQEVLREFDSKPHVEALDAESLDGAFEEFLSESLSTENRALVLDWLFNRYEQLHPSEAHILTVLLAKHGAIDAVITTNFDNLLERAESQTTGRVFEIFAPGVAQPDMEDERPVFPPLPILLKLHGDLGSRMITHLSKPEIASKRYNPPATALLGAILRSHRLIFVGYSGYDEIVADAVREADGGSGPVYWVNRDAPAAAAPVIQAFGGRPVVHVQSLYSAFMREIAQFALVDVDIGIEPGVFIPSLVANRIRQVNDRFLAGLGQGGTSAGKQVLVPRRPIEDQIERFRVADGKSLTVLASPSGCGKTSLVARLWQNEQASDFPLLLILRAQSMSDANVAGRIIGELEHGAGNAIGRLYDFASWLRSMGLELTIVLEAANEFSPRVEEVARLVRSVVEILVRVRNQRSIKILVTIRQEIWNEVFPLLDPLELSRVLWTQDAREDRPNVLAMGHFSPEEAEQAFDAYARAYRPGTRWSDVGPSMRIALQDPFLMGLVMREAAPLAGASVSRSVMERAIVARLCGRLSRTRADALMAGLDAVAAQMLRDGLGRITDRALEAGGIHAEERALLVDTDIFVDRGGTVFDFVHDRFAEVFFARAIERQGALRLTDLEDLLSILRQAAETPRLRGALVSCFAASPPDRARTSRALLMSATAFLALHLSEPGPDAQRLHAFVKDVVLEMAAHNPAQYVDLFGADLERDTTPAFMRPFLVQAAGLLPDEQAFSIWIGAHGRGSGEEKVEIETFLYDRVARCFLGSWNLSLQAVDEAPLAGWFHARDIDPFGQMRRLIGLASRLGPDNLSPREWDAFQRDLAVRLRALPDRIEIPADPAERLAWIDPLANLSALDANRFLFNARPDWLDTYYMDPARREVFVDMLDRIESGAALGSDDFMQIAPLAGMIGHPVRFLIANLLFASSFRLDRVATDAAFDEVLERLPPGVPVEQLDLLLSCLFTAHALNGLDAFARIDAYTRAIVERFPQAYLVNPGQIRGQMHGIFLDDFDQQFEDGFNPLAFYFYNAPSAWRKSVSYARSGNAGGTVPLYDELLKRFEADNTGKGVIRIVHALGQMASIWPECAMDELFKLVGRQEPTIRQSIVRVLSECFRRFPAETSAMIARSGAALSSEERYKIECARDARIRHRTFEQLQWARMIFATETASGRDILPMLLAPLVRATSWSEAILEISTKVVAALRPDPSAAPQA